MRDSTGGLDFFSAVASPGARPHLWTLALVDPAMSFNRTTLLKDSDSCW